MKGKKLFKPAQIKSWGLVVFNRCISVDAAVKFEQELIKMA